MLCPRNHDLKGEPRWLGICSGCAKAHVCVAAHKADLRYGFRCSAIRNGTQCRMRLQDLLSEPDYLHASMPESHATAGIREGTYSEGSERPTRCYRESVLRPNACRARTILLARLAGEVGQVPAEAVVQTRPRGLSASATLLELRREMAGWSRHATAALGAIE